MTKPKISICVANYNGKDIIIDCINSITHQECNALIEIIIHDDASTDNSIEIINNRYPDVMLIQSKENVGYCISNNRMAEKASGDYLLFLNNDATLHKNALETLLEHALKNKDTGILTLPQYCKNTGKLLDKGMFIDIFSNPIPNKPRTSNEVATVMGACLWIRRSLWKEIGGFPEWFSSIAEDMLICCQARLYGYTIKCCSNSGYNHLVGNSFSGGKLINNKIKTNLTRRSLSEKNKTFVIILCYPLTTLLFILPLHLTLLTIEGIVLSLLSFNLKIFLEIYANVFKEIIKQRRNLIEKRKSIQNNRKIDSREYFRVYKLFPHKITLLLKHGLPSITNKSN